jgi:excisionase family DNA binding protein
MDDILLRLNKIEQLILEQNSSTKEALNFKEACEYLEVSSSHLYKLTSGGLIPFYKPNRKKIYFKLSELNTWIFRNRSNSITEIEDLAASFQLKSKLP